jgi:hypothetical protein
MPRNKFAQIHRQLLFHWTTPEDFRGSPTTTADRRRFLDHLLLLLETGLEFRLPAPKHAEWLVKGEIEATHGMLCFCEWNVSAAHEHSGRYGGMALGFTRKFVMRAGGRPVVYVPNEKRDPFRKALISLLQHAKTDEKLQPECDLISSWLKTYNGARIQKPSNADSSTESTASSGESISGMEEKAPRTKSGPAEDRHLRVDFGGLFANLEDREWRVLGPVAQKKLNVESLPCTPGNLAMVVLPDHQTLAYAMQSEALRKKLYPTDKPAVCLLSREMLSSI